MNNISCNNCPDSHVSIALAVDTQHVIDFENLNTLPNSYVVDVTAMNRACHNAPAFDDASDHFMTNSEFMWFVLFLKSNDSSKLWHMRLVHPSINLFLKF